MFKLRHRKGFTLLLPLLLLAATALSACAHGKEDHAEKPKPDSHMRAMMAAKDQIPEDYRIMERTPILPDEDSLASGKALFRRNCAVCHGEKGDGQGPAAAALTTAPANFLDTQHSAMYNPGEKFWIIGNGSGATGMPPFKAFSPAERWDLVNYIISLQTEKGTGRSPEAMHHHD